MRRGSYSAKGVFLPSKRLLSAFYNTPPSKNPSKNLCLYWNPYQAPSKNPSKKHLLVENLLRTLLRSVRLHDPLGVRPIHGARRGTHPTCPCCFAPPFRAATLQKCGSDNFLSFSLPKVSWNLAWNFSEIFRATFFQGLGVRRENFTKISRQKRCENRKFHANFTLLGPFLFNILSMFPPACGKLVNFHRNWDNFRPTSGPTFWPISWHSPKAHFCATFGLLNFFGDFGSCGSQGWTSRCGTHYDCGAWRPL